jgi:RNA polymerase sigma-70 factor (ECF subfamily)
MTIDEHILNQIKLGDQQAFHRLFDHYWKRLFVYALKALNNPEACEDAIQEVFIDLWERKEQLEISNLKGFLFQSVRNKIANQIRRTKFTEGHLSIISEASLSDNSTENTIDFQETELTIHSAIERLPHRCREVFYLSRFERLNNQQIAAKLNLSIRTVETHISNALKNLRSSLKDTAATLSLMIIIFVF